MNRIPLYFIPATLLSLLVAEQLHAQSPPQLIGVARVAPDQPPVPFKPGQVISAQQEATLNQLITELVRQHLPHTFEDKRNWEKTAERWDGVDMHWEGLKLKTKRRKKRVNHGTWTMYNAQLVNPNQELNVVVENIRETDDGRVAFDLFFTTPLAVKGRYAQWVKGVQMIALSAEATARIQLKVECVMAVGVDITTLPPDVLFDPAAADADLQLVEFDLYRISKVGGEVADQLGRGIKHFLDKEIEEKRPKLVESINHELEKNKPKMRLSINRAIASKWGGVIEDQLKKKPLEVKASAY